MSCMWSGTPKKKPAVMGPPTEFLLVLVGLPGCQHAVHLFLFEIYLLPQDAAKKSQYDPASATLADPPTSTGATTHIFSHQYTASLEPHRLI